MKRGDVIVITGASAGVGRATARAFARLGCSIGLLARGRDGLDAAADEVERLGGRALILPADVADHRVVEAAADAVERAFGRIDVWINNAMVSVFSRVREMQPEEYRRVTEVTYLGVVHGTLAALRRMLPRNHGTIVQVGSALAYRAIPLQSAYCAAKHAVRGFTDSLRAELIDEGSRIRLTHVHLPALNTPQFDWVKSRLPNRGQPVPPIFQPEVAADAILHAAYHPRREYFVGWPTMKMVLANKLAPRYLDRYLARNVIDSQQTDEPERPNRPHNLWNPLPGDHGAHGRFDDRAKPISAQFELSKHRNAILTLALLGLAAAACGLARARQHHKRADHPERARAQKPATL
jgi:short-subunit dehydrogenase